MSRSDGEQHDYPPEIRELALRYQAALEHMEIQYFNEIQGLQLEVQRYRKLKNEIRTKGVVAIQGMASSAFDEAVDALPDPEKEKG